MNRDTRVWKRTAEILAQEWNKENWELMVKVAKARAEAESAPAMRNDFISTSWKVAECNAPSGRDDL